MTYPPFYVLRHGETEWNRAGRFQGAANSPLTETGRVQARAQGELLRTIDLDVVQIFVSPKGRAFETAAIALSGRVPLLRTDDRLREIDIGDWTGARHDELRGVTGSTRPDTPDGALAIYDHAPGGEGFAGLRARCESFLADLTGPTLCVTHGITSRMLRALALGLPPARLGELPGGQGVIHIVRDGQHETLA